MNYWERRSAGDMERAQEDALRVLEEIEALHRQAAQRVRGFAGRLRQRFAMAYGMDRETANAMMNAPVGREEYLKLLEEIGKLGKNNPRRAQLLAKAAAPAYAYRESLQTAMEDEINAVTAQMAEREARRLSAHLQSTMREESLRAGYRVARQAGVGIAFGGVSEELARVMIARPWSGASFSERVWKNQAALSDILNTVLREGLTTGRSTEGIAQDIAQAMGVSQSRARTLVRTETTYVCNQADMAAYDEAGIGQYRFLATLDMKTSRICQRLDGQEFARAEAQVGKNCPPMHPNCRSTTVTVLTQEDMSRMKRIARDPVTGKTVKVPASMTYEQWLAMQKETYGEERIEAARQMAKNRKADKAQFAQYQKALGKKHLPATLAKFQEMKYTEPEEWARTKRAKATIGEIDAKESWNEAFRKKAKETYWTMRGNDVEMSAHAIARYLQRKGKADGGFSTQRLAEVCRREANYMQPDGRRVHLYDGVALIFSAESGEMVSFVTRREPRADWRRLQ